MPNERELKPFSKLTPLATSAEWEANEDRNAPRAHLEPFAPIINPFPEGTWEHDDCHETECFRQAFARLPNASRKE